MLTRTWEYGAERRVIVLGASPGVLVVTDGTEGHILIGQGAADGQPGDRGKIVFCAGGPTGGHWRFTREGGAEDA